MSGGRNSPLLLLSSPLGDDTLPVQAGTLHAIGLAARERLSAPFEVDLTVVSTERAIAPEELLHRAVSVTVRRRDGRDRAFHGLVRRMEALGFEQRGRWRYQLEVVPRLWFLAQSVDCRIFQQKTAVEILQVLFAEHGVEPVDFRIFADRPRREYTTQFNETDLDFAHRLMQESGYFYFFEHTPTRHRLVVADANEAFRAPEAMAYRVIHNGENVDIIDTWSEALATTVSRVRLEDHDPERPATPVSGEQAATIATPGASGRRAYRWPAMTMQGSVAHDRARFRVEAAQATASLRRGHGFDPALCPGHRFTLARDPFTGAENLDHAVRETRHEAADETWVGGTSPPSYDCHFTCIRQSVPWRDEPSLPRPAMGGIFSAIVLGEAGEEIHADPLGRIKVRPLFDHRCDTVASMAIWARILNAWSGKGWGWQHLPRVGTEVGLSFMNGDPDSPVVAGCFYNADDMPPFPIPARKTVQGFRSRSTLRGGTQQYSELSFDDRLDQELVLLHAQRDHKVEVERDQNSTIGRDRSVVTTHDDTLLSETGSIDVTAATGAVTISAARSVTLRVGATSIVLTEAGITLSTPGVVSTEAIGDVNTMAMGLVSIEGIGDVNILGGAVTIEALDGEVDCIPFPV